MKHDTPQQPMVPLVAAEPEAIYETEKALLAAGRWYCTTEGGGPQDKEHLYVLLQLMDKLADSRQP